MESDLRRGKASERKSSILQRVGKLVLNLSLFLDDLETFSNLNWMAFYKVGRDAFRAVNECVRCVCQIYKKRDKLSGVARMTRDLDEIREQPFRKKDQVDAVRVSY